MATKAELYAQAQSLDVEGRSEMNKAELEAAIADAAAVDEEVAEAVEEVEEALVELDESNDEPEPQPKVVEVTPVIVTDSEAPKLAGGLTFMTDRAQ